MPARDRPGGDTSATRKDSVLARLPTNSSSSPGEPRAARIPGAGAPNAQGDVFLREVDDALREDQLLAAIRRYGKMAGAAIAAALLALAGYLWWGAHQESLAAAQAENFTAALDNVSLGNLPQASAQLQPLTSASGKGTQAAARLLQADIAAKRGTQGEADRIYRELADDGSAPAPYRDLANIRDVAMRFDTMPPDEVIARLRALAAPGNPWFGSAGELLGLAYVKQGRNDLAAPLFGAIARDKTVPETLKARARQMAAALGHDSVDDITGEAAPAGDGAPAAAQPAHS